MRILVTSSLVVAAIGGSLLATAPAKAQNYPWCAEYGGRAGGTNCGFSTWEQCMETRLGMGGFCVRNYMYEPPAPRVRQRRVYPR